MESIGDPELAPELSKSQLKKVDKKAQKQAKKDTARQQKEEQSLAVKQIVEKVAKDITDDTFGYHCIEWSAHHNPAQRRKWTSLKDINSSCIGNVIWARGRLQESRIQGVFAFLVLRSDCETLQLVLDGRNNLSKDAIRWAGSVPLESVIDVYGQLTVPDVPIKSSSIDLEMQVTKIFCISKAAPELPFQLKDATCPENDTDSSETSPETFLIRVGQDVRLDNRVLDLRTIPNQALFRIQAAVCHIFRHFLTSHDFVEIHTPKLISGVSEGGASAFALTYFDRPACLAQSPQLYKQMALNGDFDRVFEIAPVFRAENSNTHRHLCEFVGLDFEMTIKESYHEILEIVNKMFNCIFDGLTTKYKTLVDSVREQYNVEPFKWIGEAPKLLFQHGVEMLRAAGATGIPDDISAYDLSTENEKLLGKLVKAKFNTDFYMLIRYPLAVRPFYTMPDPSDDTWSNSYDIFMRGEEIISGAQRIHDSGFLTERATAHGIDVKTIETYIDSFKLGAYPHGGIGVGLERVVMLFFGLGNIRKTSLFPRDPKRLTP